MQTGDSGESGPMVHRLSGREQTHSDEDANSLPAYLSLTWKREAVPWILPPPPGAHAAPWSRSVISLELLL